MFKEATLGVIVGNRGFFPDHLCDTGRKTVLDVLAQQGIKTVALTADDTKFGSIESLADADKCASLFKRHAGARPLKRSSGSRGRPGLSGGATRRRFGR